MYVYCVFFFNLKVAAALCFFSYFTTLANRLTNLTESLLYNLGYFNNRGLLFTKLLQESEVVLRSRLT